MGIAHAQVVFQAYTHLPIDDIVNTFTFSGSGTALDVATSAEAALEDFYMGPGTGGGIAGNYFSPAISMADTVVKWYKLSDTSATDVDAHAPGTGFGSPILTVPIHPAEPSGTALPNQVAIAVSYHGVLEGLAEHSGAGPRPAERLRGRVYLGPWSTTALDHSTVTHGPIVNSGVLGGIHDAADRLRVSGGVGHAWAVWSRKNNKVYSVVGGFVDDRFDTQRRRVMKTTSRSPFGLSGRG